MLTIRFQESDLPIETIREIESLGDFALSWYLAKFGGEVSDLDPVYIKFSTPQSDPGRYGAAQDNEQLDVLTIRTDAFDMNGELTSRGWDTVAHEFIHLCQYITDFERRYDVPYAERPQEVQAFKYSSELVRAYRDNKISVAPDKPAEDKEPLDLPYEEKEGRKWTVIGVVILIVTLIGLLSVNAEPVQDEHVYSLRNHVLYNDGTERRYTSVLNDEWRDGTYVDVITGAPLFRSEWKFDSQTGWPSFHTVEMDNVQLIEEWHPWYSIYEVRSADGERHYGHLFLESQWPEGRRFCINGVALRFIPDD